MFQSRANSWFFRSQNCKSKCRRARRVAKVKEAIARRNCSTGDSARNPAHLRALRCRSGWLLVHQRVSLLHESCMLSATPELEERVESTFTAIDIAIATEFVREVRENMHIADRMKEEFFSILNLSEVRTGPIQEIKTLNSILCVGSLKYLLKK